jgi:hypothetical protein
MRMGFPDWPDETIEEGEFEDTDLSEGEFTSLGGIGFGENAHVVAAMISAIARTAPKIHSTVCG